MLRFGTVVEELLANESLCGVGLLSQRSVVQCSKKCLLYKFKKHERFGCRIFFGTLNHPETKRRCFKCFSLGHQSSYCEAKKNPHSDSFCSVCFFPKGEVGIGPKFEKRFIHHDLTKPQQELDSLFQARKKHEDGQLCGSGLQDCLFLTVCFLHFVVPEKQLLCEHGLASRCSHEDCPLRKKFPSLKEFLNFLTTIDEPSNLFWLIKVVALYADRVKLNTTGKR